MSLNTKPTPEGAALTDKEKYDLYKWPCDGKMVWEVKGVKPKMALKYSDAYEAIFLMEGCRYHPTDPTHRMFTPNGARRIKELNTIYFASAKQFIVVSLAKQQREDRARIAELKKLPDATLAKPEDIAP